MTIITLQVDSFGDAFLPEHVMASPHALDESELPEQSSHVVEAQTCIRATAENSMEQ